MCALAALHVQPGEKLKAGPGGASPSAFPWGAQGRLSHSTQQHCLSCWGTHSSWMCSIFFRAEAANPEQLSGRAASARSWEAVARCDGSAAQRLPRSSHPIGGVGSMDKCRAGMWCSAPQGPSMERLKRTRWRKKILVC